MYVQVLVNTSGQLLPSLTSLPLTSPLPSQLSVQLRSLIAGTSLAHSYVASTGAVKTGASVSSIVIVWLTLVVLLQASV